MVSVNNFSSSAIIQNSHSLRRRINAELEEIREFISHILTPDLLVQAVGSWRDNFYRQMRSSADEQSTLSTYSEQLNQLLSQYPDQSHLLAARLNNCWLRGQSTPTETVNRPQISETILRTELLGIHEKLRNCSLNDDVTNFIREWYQDFSAALNVPGADVQVLLNDYITDLKEILIDGFTGDLLDETVYLGSDGVTYGEMSITIYNQVAGEFGYLSLFHIANPESFTVVEHDPLIKHMINWLRAHDSYHLNPQRAQLFDDLRSWLRQRFREVSADDQALQQLEQDLENMRIETFQELHEQFLPIHQQIRQTEERLSQVVEGITEADLAHLAEVRRQVLQNTEALEILTTRIQNWTADREVIERELAEVVAEDQRLTNELQTLQTTHANNNIRLRELQQEEARLINRQANTTVQHEALQAQSTELVQQEERNEILRNQVQVVIAQAEQRTTAVESCIVQLRNAQQDLNTKQAITQQKLIEFNDKKKALAKTQADLDRKKNQLINTIKLAKKARHKSKSAFGLKEVLTLAASVAVCVLVTWATAGTGLSAAPSMTGGTLTYAIPL